MLEIQGAAFEINGKTALTPIEYTLLEGKVWPYWPQRLR